MKKFASKRSFGLAHSLLQNDQARSSAAIHLAAFFGLSEVVDTFLRENANIDECDESGATAIHWAILGNQNDMLGSLLEKGAKVDIRSNACCLRRWFNWSDPGFRLPLQMAASRGNIRAIELLLKRGSNVNELTQYSEVNVSYLSPITALTAALMND